MSVAGLVRPATWALKLRSDARATLRKDLDAINQAMIDDLDAYGREHDRCQYLGSEDPTCSPKLLLAMWRKNRTRRRPAPRWVSNIAGSAIGGVLGRFAVTLVADLFDWRLATALVGFVGLACSVLFRASVPPTRGFMPTRYSARSLAATGRLLSDRVLPCSISKTSC